MKNSISDVPLANDRLNKEVALLMKMEPHEVRKIARFIGRYIAYTIAKGQMEAVMLPYFGKFKPKRSIHVSNKVLANQRNGFDLLYRAIHGRRVLDLRNKTSLDSMTGGKLKRL